MEIRVLYESQKCRVLIVQDEHDRQFILNQLQQKELIKRYMPDLFSDCTDLIECFISGNDFFAVFRHHCGLSIDSITLEDTVSLLNLCDGICRAAQLEDLSAPLLECLLCGECFIVCDDDRVRLNKQFALIETETDGEQTADKLACLLLELTERAKFDPVQRYTLRAFTGRLSQPFSSLLELYTFVNGFSRKYEPHSTEELLLDKWNQLKGLALALYEKAGFWLAAALLIFAATLAFVRLTEPAAMDDVLTFTHLGGRELNERGAIEEGYYEIQTNHR